MTPDSVSRPSPERRSLREEHLTPSGIRIVGPGARDLAARLSQPRGVSPGRAENMLFAARFLVRPRLGAGSALNAVLDVLNSAVAEQRKDAPPPLSRDRPVELPAARFAGLSWAVLGRAGEWTGELMWRHAHPVLAGAPCTTHVILIELANRLDLHVRVSADEGLASVHGATGAGQARPPFLSELNQAARLTFDGQESAPRVLADGDVERFAREVLLAEDRHFPVAVLAPLEQGGFALPPEELADALLGLAPLYVIERHPSTFRLTDVLGDRRLSAYWGALRIYRAGFSCGDRPEEHPLLMRERLIDPVMRADVLGRLGRAGAQRLVMPAGVAARRSPPPAAPVTAAPATSVRSAEESPARENADPGIQAGSSAEPLTSLTAAIAKLTEMTASLLDEMMRLRTTTAVRATNTIALERRIGGLEAALKRHFAPAATDSGDPHQAPDDGLPDAGEVVTLAGVLREAAESHPETLLILESAERSAEESPYEDADRVGVILDAMAEVARRRQGGALGASLREAFRELGIDYRGGISTTTPERLRRQYRLTGPGGKTYECEEHVVLGTSYDPKRCLRIYFTSRAPLEARFVIGHVGRHFEVGTTT